VSTYTAYQTSDGQANFEVCAGGLCQPVIVELDSSYYDGSSAEYIDERPDFCAPSYCYKPITNFAYNNWNGSAENSAGTWEGLDSAGGYAVNMINSSKQTLVGPTAYAGATTYTDTWFRAE
jgi:hypothetical protein